MNIEKWKLESKRKAGNIRSEFPEGKSGNRQMGRSVFGRIYGTLLHRFTDSSSKWKDYVG